MSSAEKGVTVFLGGLIVVAVAAVLVKNGSNTSQALTGAGGALSSSLSAAEGNPVP